MELSLKKCLKKPSLNSESGVTMLEMVAALSLTAFMLAVLSQLLFSGIRLWNNQDHSYAQQHRFKFIYTTLYNDFGTILVGDYLPCAAVKGDDTKVKFWSDSGRGMVLVSYAYDPEIKAVRRWEGLWGQVEEPGVPLFKDVTSWKVEYYKTKYKSWVTEWAPDTVGEVPSMIQVTVKTKTGNLGTMTFPVKAWRKKDGN